MPTIELRKFQTTVYQNVSTTDISQTPAAGSTFTVYKQGGTISSAGSIASGGSGTINVYSSGSLAVNDTIQIGTSTVQTGTITAFTPNTLTVTNTAGVTLVFAIGDRVVPTNNQPILYSDGRQTNNITNPITVSATGLVTFYTPATRFDYIVSGSGLTSTLYTDGESGWALGTLPVINVRDYPSIQAAVDSVPNILGRRPPIVYIPAGDYSTSGVTTFTPPLLLPTDRPVHLIGAGKEATFLNSTDPTVNMIEVRGNYQTVEDMRLFGSGTAGIGRGVQIGRSAADDTGDVLHQATLRNLEIGNTSSYAIGLYGITTANETGPKTVVNANSLSIETTLENIRAYGNRQDGLLYSGRSCTTLYINECSFEGYLGTGVKLQQTYGAQLNNVVIEDGPSDKPALLIVLSNNVTCTNLWCESHHSAAPTEYFVVVQGEAAGITFISPEFNRDSVSSSTCKFMHFDNKVSGAVVVAPWGHISAAFAGDTDHIQIDDPLNPNFSSGVSIIGPAVVQDTANGYLPMSIIWGGAVPKGTMFGGDRKIRLPAITSTQRDAAAPFGMRPLTTYDTVLNSTINALQIYDGAKWRSFPPPIITSTQRDVATETANWQDGSTIYVTDVPAYFDRQAGAWRIRTGSALTTTQRDAATWTPVNGDIIYNTTTTAYNIRLGAAWKVSSWT